MNSSCVNTFSKPGMCLYDDHDEKAPSTPVDFGPIDVLLSKPRVKRAKESALGKYPPNALQLYRRNMMAMVAFSAASMGTAALLLLNSGTFRYALIRCCLFSPPIALALKVILALRLIMPFQFSLALCREWLSNSGLR